MNFRAILAALLTVYDEFATGNAKGEADKIVAIALPVLLAAQPTSTAPTT